MEDLLLTPLVMLSALLALAYVYARRRDAKGMRKGYAPRQRPQRSASARLPWKAQRHSDWFFGRDAAQPQKRRDARPQRDRVIDLHQRGAIFAVTEAAQLDGYTLTELGDVRVDGGAGHEARLRRAAAQQYSAANALVNLREVCAAQQKRGGKDRAGHWQTINRGQPKKPPAKEWRAMAVIANPLLADVMPPETYRDDLVLIDGSNVMNWEVDAGIADAPSLRPLAQVLADLKARGVAAGVVFDATAGHRLEGRFLGHDDLAKRLPTAADVLVVDRGTQADWVLVDMARAQGLVIISNDHFRDAPAARHLLKQKGYVVGDGVTLLEPRA